MTYFPNELKTRNTWRGTIVKNNIYSFITINSGVIATTQETDFAVHVKQEGQSRSDKIRFTAMTTLSRIEFIEKVDEIQSSLGYPPQGYGQTAVHWLSNIDSVNFFQWGCHASCD